MTAVTVYKYMCWNHDRGKDELAPRATTREKIKTLAGAYALEDTGQEVEESDLDDYGFFVLDKK